jgi:hypothetical protein
MFLHALTMQKALKAALSSLNTTDVFKAVIAHH